MLVPVMTDALGGSAVSGNPHFIVSKRLRVSSVNAAECGRLYYIYSEIPRDVRGVVTIDTFVTFFRIRQVRTVLHCTVDCVSSVQTNTAAPLNLEIPSRRHSY